MKTDKVMIIGDEQIPTIDEVKEALKPTPRQIAGRYEIINERPEGMSYEEYKKIRRNQTKLLKQCRR